MWYGISVEARQHRIELKGQIDFNATQAFRNSYRQVLQQPGCKQLEVHLGKVETIDTSGLGMLLRLHREASAQGVAIALNECPPMVKRMLEESCFDRLFAIRGKLQ
jgi:anti-anti-sigma factor